MATSPKLLEKLPEYVVQELGFDYRKFKCMEHGTVDMIQCGSAISASAWEGQCIRSKCARHELG